MRNSSIFIISNFKGSKFGGGGEKRSYQIEEILNKEGIGFFSYDFVPIKYSDVFLIISMETFSFIFGILKGGWNTFKQFVYYKKNLKGILKKLEEIQPKLILWEATLVIPNLPSQIRDLNIPIVALPHNIESLVFRQKTFFSKIHSSKYLNYELNQLLMCDNIFVVSEFDYLSFHQYPEKVRIFPYYPPNIQFFEKIRKARLDAKRNFFLILGSATNPPTYYGIKEILSLLTSELISESFVLAGNGTENFKVLLKNHSNFKVLGFVELLKLKYLLSNCRAIIINHPLSSGLINRLIECQIAGVPIVGNRNYFEDRINDDGFYLYEDFNSLKRILEESDFISPKTPINRNTEELDFIETVKSFLN